MAGPIDHHPHRDDPASAGAIHSVAIGDRTVVAISDGFFCLPQTFLGTASHPTTAHDMLQATYGHTRLPIGCFLLRGERTVLIDAGFGPEDYDGLGLMVGGRLLDHLADQHLQPSDIDVLALTHIHGDHIGWIADRDGEPHFANAVLCVGRADWDHFVGSDERPPTGPSSPSAPPSHILRGFRLLAERGQVRLLDGRSLIAPGVWRLPAPGHTPGHSIYAAHDRSDRLLLLGDSIYLPQQLTGIDWTAASDVDPVLAAHTRAAFARDVQRNGGSVLGSHFPGLVEERLARN